MICQYVNGAFSLVIYKAFLFVSFCCTLWNSDSGTARQNPQFSTVLALDKAGSDFLQPENSVSQMCTGKDRRCSFLSKQNVAELGTSFVLESRFGELR